MDPKYDSSRAMLALPARGGAVLSFPPSEPSSGSCPPVDEHIVSPETTREEVIRGRKLIAQPALEPHADKHANLDFVILPHVRKGYRASIDLLTRTSESSDFATDLSIRKEGNDPETGRRYLEEISFEIVNEQSMRDVREKAEELTARGVRRIFAIFVKHENVAEWSQEKRNFVTLDESEKIEDPCLLRPISIKALLDAAIAEIEVVRALARKKNPEIEAIKEQAAQKGHRDGHREGHRDGYREGRDEGRREVLFELLSARFGELPQAAKARIQAANTSMLEQWTKRLLSATSLDELLDEE